MPARRPFNQLDPFGANEEQFQTRSIRDSRSHAKKEPFKDSLSKRSNSNPAIIYGIIASIILVGIILLLTIPRSFESDPTIGEDPLVNPTGREASSEYTTNTSDPELRAREQNKLDTLLALVNDESWEYANATFETIFPDYLDACGRYEYYRAARALSENFESFSISRETAETRMDYLLEKCDKLENQ